MTYNKVKKGDIYKNLYFCILNIMVGFCLSIITFLFTKTPLVWTFGILAGVFLHDNESKWIQIIGTIIIVGSLIGFIWSTIRFIKVIWEIINIPIRWLQDFFLGRLFFEYKKEWKKIIYPNETIKKIFWFIGNPIYFGLLFVVFNILIFTKPYESGVIQKDIEYSIGDTVVLKNDENDKYMGTITDIIYDENINISIFIGYEIDDTSYGEIGWSSIDGDKILGRYIETQNFGQSCLKTIPMGILYVLWYFVNIIKCMIQLFGEFII